MARLVSIPTITVSVLEWPEIISPPAENAVGQYILLDYNALMMKLWTGIDCRPTEMLSHL